MTYEFDPASDALRRSTRLGPTVLRSSQTLGEGTFNLRLAASYFEVGQMFQPIDYLVVEDEPRTGATEVRRGVIKFGLSGNAKVAVTTLSASYGLLNRVDLTGSLPITVVDASAAESFSTLASTLHLPPGEARVTGPPVGGGTLQAAINLLNDGLGKRELVMREERFTALNIDFNEGTHVGVGRISLGAKGLLFAHPALQVACMGEIFLPSPSSADFAGSNSVAILPRLIGAAVITDWLRLYSDVGYQYDFDEAPLRRFTWSIGGSAAWQRVAADLGFGGSEFDAPIQWTPTVAHSARTPEFLPTTIHALGDTSTSDSYVDLLLGIKFRLTDAWVVAGAVTIPVVREDFQPDALGTIAFERYF